MSLIRQVAILSLFLTCMLGFSGPGYTQIRNQLPVGTRPHSMGEAFVAVADDGNAMHWNPAGLANMERIQLGFDYADLFGLDIDSYHLSFISRLYPVPALTDLLTLGVDWHGISTGDSELNFTRDQLLFSLGLKPPKRISLLRSFSFGFNAKYLSINGKLDGANAADASGWGWDFGLMYNLDAASFLPKGLNLGLMIHDITGTNVTHRQTRRSERILERNVRWGLSYRPFKEWRLGGGNEGGGFAITDPLLAFDIDDRIHLGLECWLADHLALRMGFQKDLHAEKDVTLSFGAGIRLDTKDIPAIGVDYASTNSPVLPNTGEQFGGTIIPRINPRIVRIEEVHLNDVYSSIYRDYLLPGNFGNVKITNGSKDPLKCYVSVKVAKYIKSTLTDTLNLAPESSLDLPLRAAFSSDILGATRTGRDLTAEVRITYLYDQRPYTSREAVGFRVYDKNSSTWDDPGKAAAFVSLNDPVVRSFVTKALAKKAQNETPWFFRRSFDAMLLYEALQGYGFTYQPDPVTPFPSFADTLRGALHRRDMIHYPAEFLTAPVRFGDCDDMSVLYCSILQEAGLETALVSGPGHVFMMFNTRIPQQKIHSLPVASVLFVKHKKTLWIPIEATKIPKESFVESWRFAANRLNNAGSDTTWKIYEIAASQAKYPPIDLKHDPGQSLSGIPDFSSGIARSLNALDEMKGQYLKTFADSLKRFLPNEETSRIKNNYGLILGANGDYDMAKVQLREILNLEPDNGYALNNLANICFIQGQFDSAAVCYEKALQSLLVHHGVYLNLALLYQVRKDENLPEERQDFFQKKSEEYIRDAAKLYLDPSTGSADANDAYALLGFSDENDASKAGIFDEVWQKIKDYKDYIDQSFKKFVRREDKTVSLKRHGVKGRGELDDDLWAVLWWSYQSKERFGTVTAK